MLNDILTEVGRPYAHSRFSSRFPSDTCIVYIENITAEGPDNGTNRIFTHNVTVEVYEPTADDAVEADFESVLNTRGILWEKQDRYWLKDLQRYQTVYEFTYIEKK